MAGLARNTQQGPRALLQLRQPVNRFPDFVRYAVQRLKTLCPMMGKVKIAQILARAGLHLSPTTVGRMLREPPHPVAKQQEVVTGRVVTARGPNHVWHLDLTIVPTVSGFWAPWVPFALPTLRSWCQRKGIRPRYGAVGKHGSIAVVERAIRTLKDECTRRILVPQRQTRFRRELLCFLGWYNEYRPHMTLEGSTPNEVYFRQYPANRRPRVEPRKQWPRRSQCAKPRTLVAGQPGDRFSLEVGYHDRRRHLPVVSLRRAA